MLSEGALVTITASATNTFITTNAFPITMSIINFVVNSESVIMAAGATETVTFTTIQPLGT